MLDSLLTLPSRADGLGLGRLPVNGQSGGWRRLRPVTRVRSVTGGGYSGAPTTTWPSAEETVTVTDWSCSA